jgi:hypothetical protein
MIPRHLQRKAADHATDGLILAFIHLLDWLIQLSAPGVPAGRRTR